MDFNSIDWMAATGGGLLIGLSATLLLLFNGSVAGISGIFRKAISTGSVESLLFIMGLAAGAAIYELGIARTPTPEPSAGIWYMIAGGLLVGIGARLGNGCTSGHGVCGLGFLSFRSLVAVITFMITGIVTVWVIRHGGLLP